MHWRNLSLKLGKYIYECGKEFHVILIHWFLHDKFHNYLMIWHKIQTFLLLLHNSFKFCCLSTWRSYSPFVDITLLGSSFFSPSILNPFSFLRLFNKRVFWRIDLLGYYFGWNKLHWQSTNKFLDHTDKEKWYFKVPIWLPFEVQCSCLNCSPVLIH